MSSIKLEKVKKVDEALLKEIVRRILQVADVEKIVLFGSHAYGKPKPESDLDILVIMRTNLSLARRPVPIYQSLRGLLIGKDIVVFTPEEVEEWREVPQAFITSILRKGKILYEKQT